MDELKPRAVDQPRIRFAFSICTLVSDTCEYGEMVESFRLAGFTNADCEYLFVDNSRGNRLDAFQAYNLFLQQSSGEFIILVHQDVVLLEQGRGDLERVLDELDRIDKNWGAVGNAGVNNRSGRQVVRISQLGTKAGTLHEYTLGGPFPALVNSLDENFILVKHNANLALSHDLSGYHWYGHDIVLIAEILGWSAYVVDFNLLHKSRGSVDQTYVDAGKELRSKYSRAFRDRWQVSISSGRLYLSGSRARSFWARCLGKIRHSLGRRVTRRADKIEYAVRKFP